VHQVSFIYKIIQRCTVNKTENCIEMLCKIWNLMFLILFMLISKEVHN